jgi:capsular polysaccharide biosynthesis protein
MDLSASMNQGESQGEKIWLRAADQDPAASVDSLEPSSELKSKEALYYPPAFAHRSDREFFAAKGIYGKPRLGYAASAVRIRRARDCHLLLSRSLEGVLFNEEGIKRHYGFLAASQTLPNGISKEGDRYYLDRSMVDDAPLLSGDYLIFYNGNLQNYYHWMVEGIIALYVLRRILGDSAKIVLPSGLEQASNLRYSESLELFGFDSMDVHVSPDPVVKLERAHWVEPIGDPVESMPDHIIVEMQSYVTERFGTSGSKKRIYVERERLRRVANADEVRRFLEGCGFNTVRLESLSVFEQARIFANAEFVIGPHGAGLSNLMFSPPGARVIELTPITEMRPFFWLISMKLRHEYGMLPCATDTGTFNGDLQVDMAKLGRLLAFLEHA